ncbi:hypothetical protein LCGC14_0839240 [marine sediment metagenome]|uniref:Bacteriophage head to tail connecting protein n=1 Tax=marine sediment metagenome TaxID=412755 RepID=A0A0F9PDP4_9ZZZZ
MAQDLEALEYFEKRRGALSEERNSFVPHYKDLSKFTQPRRGRFSKTDRNVGGPRYSSIINSRATQALRTARAGLFAGVMSPSRPWFAMRVLDDPELMEFRPVKVWLHDVELVLREIFNRSNLYNMAPVMLGDLLLFATGCMTHVKDFQTVARFYTHTPGSYMIGQDERLEVTTLVREFQMQVSQMVGDFGLDNVSVGVRSAWDRGDYDSWHDIVHFIEPNPSANPSRRASRFKAFRSVKYEPGNAQTAGVNERFLSRMGFDRFPAYVPRWDVTGEDIYGTDCPGMTALGDVKSLQVEEKRKAQGIDKMVNPPLQGPATLSGVPVSSLPGGLTIYTMGQGEGKLEPIYKVAPQLQDMAADIDKVERRIDEAFFVNLFLAISNMEGIQPKNEMELAHRNAERLLQLGPVLERLYGDFHNDLIDRTFDQAVEADLLPLAPPEIQGMSLKVVYISSLAMAQRSVAVGGIRQLAAYVGELRGAGYEEVLDKFDADQSVDEVADLTGVPPRLVVPDDAVAEVRQERAEEQERQLQAAQALEAVKVGAGAAKDLGAAAGGGGGG